MKDMCDVIDLYKFGIKENPWNTLDYAEMKDQRNKTEQEKDWNKHLFPH